MDSDFVELARSVKYLDSLTRSEAERQVLAPDLIWIQPLHHRRREIELWRHPTNSIRPRFAKASEHADTRIRKSDSINQFVDQRAAAPQNKILAGPHWPEAATIHSR